MSENHHIHSSELDSRKNLMQYNCKIVPDLRSLKHTHTHTHTHTRKCKDSIIKTKTNKKDLEQSIKRIMGHSLLQ